jgi:hypothetical protein
MFISASFEGYFLSLDYQHLPLLICVFGYLATPMEVGQRLRETAKGRGGTILYERHEWGPRTRGAGSIEEIPHTWRFSAERAEQLFGEA